MATPQFHLPSQFKLVFDPLPNCNYYLQSLSLPGVTAANVEVPSPFGSVTPLHGDRLTYDEFTFQFILDEDLNNYKEVYNWLRSLTRGQSYYDFYTNDAIPDNTATYDAKLFFLDSFYEVSSTITFKNLFPISLGSIDLDYSDTDPEPKVCAANFRYDFYVIE